MCFIQSSADLTDIGHKDDYDTFHCRKWWLDLIGKGDDFEVVMDFDLDCFDEAWNDWFISEHEYAVRDKAYFDRGMGEYLFIVNLVKLTDTIFSEQECLFAAMIRINCIYMI